jgi:hypothetical protein
MIWVVLGYFECYTLYFTAAFNLEKCKFLKFALAGNWIEIAR